MALPIDPVVLIPSVTLRKCTPAFQIIDEGQQVAGIAPQAVQLPENNLVSVPQVIEHRVQPGPTRPRSTHTMASEDPVATCSLQCCMLQVRVLVSSADPGRIHYSHSSSKVERSAAGLVNSSRQA